MIKFTKTFPAKFLLAAVLSIVSDQLSKVFVSQIIHVQLNTGVSLSWLPGLNQLTVAIVLSLFLAGIAWGWRRVWGQYPVWSGIFFGAAVSNILDRLLYNGVRDWLSLPGTDLKNNLADWLVCVSLAAIILQMFRQPKLSKDAL